ncbi:nucleotidyltransferase domain-containing protein [Chitiniphilus eburneus]|uniref:Nucleotidyltransferase domain-containing protein n=1 Tax=Chitiniphilus eburneus TaxID=2571148 RepID=A0A4U0PMI7_9NEIS|nr:nucleotidyltransferase domain-containing protein [Chitiniphilus eburneus]TJZ69376.1 nucleotidyltransferase domain-containing protein [Chitiniphilus eburneus]
MDILSAHPIDPAVRERVMAELAAIETRHDVRVLFACESGSRGWGFASPDSDYDVRFLYVHRLDWYLRVEPQRDVIEVPISDELDVAGWELRKALQLLRRSNPTLLEWLDSPVIYRQDDAAVARLRALSEGFFSERKGRWHYLMMARKNFRGYLQGDTVRLKKYLYVLRPLLAARWIDAGRGRPPMRFAELVEAMVGEVALCEEINRLLAIKMAAGEAEHGPRFPLIHAFIERELATEQAPQDFNRPEGDDAALDRLLFDMVTAP